jgi:hypothetical protein
MKFVPNEVRCSLEDKLFPIPGVTAVSTGDKVVEGFRTNTPSIRIHVEKKKAEAEIPRDERIPPIIDGIPTDVIESRFVFLPEMSDDSEAEDACDSQLKGGIGIAPGGNPTVRATGTLGAIVKDRASSQMMFLTCHHVLAHLEEHTPIQWVKPGEMPPEVIGILRQFRLNRDGSRQKNLCFNDTVDCAVVPLENRDEYLSEILGIGRIRGTCFARRGMQVRKWAQKTGLSYGIVDTIDMTVKIVKAGREFRFTNQIGIIADPAHGTAFGDRGDSGAVIVNEGQEAVGLYFACSEDGTYGVANAIHTVLEQLNVDMYEHPLNGLAKDIDDSMRLIASLTKLSASGNMLAIPPGRLQIESLLFADGGCCCQT